MEFAMRMGRLGIIGMMVAALIAATQPVRAEVALKMSSQWAENTVTS
jgi:hypothetical protein